MCTVPKITLFFFLRKRIRKTCENTVLYILNGYSFLIDIISKFSYSKRRRLGLTFILFRASSLITKYFCEVLQIRLLFLV